MLSTLTEREHCCCWKHSGIQPFLYLSVSRLKSSRQCVCPLNVDTIRWARPYGGATYSPTLRSDALRVSVASRDIVSYILRVSQDMTSSQRVLVIPLKYRLRRVNLRDTPNIECITTRNPPHDTSGIYHRQQSLRHGT